MIYYVNMTLNEIVDYFCTHYDLILIIKSGTEFSKAQQNNVPT